ncbi:NAD(P)/FAD-dependent oxidoreductase [Brevibacillus sp. Leaf182]|uniref:NAD(P)/FAD-dependent oxidoreductase n=1 Tax=Brevibacillus sp. Leaf182 TaxID=1736290 RepID=UPI0006F85FD7|nr:FAD-dependent oxidoreductase [Brevibacillus sp. Leaf182]RAT96546.1 FAD-binding protein [Brevibacillus sp. Leaf182]
MRYDLVIIGAGISGLTAALSAWEGGVSSVLMIDYQKRRGGFTLPYWSSDEFAPERELLDKAASLPYEIHEQSTVVGFFPGGNGQLHQLYVQSPMGTYSIEAKKVLIASGSLEKPREAHKIPGTRPAGVMTPMMAMQLIERGYQPGRKIVLIENGRISRSTATLLEKETSNLVKYAESDWELTSIKGLSRVEGVQLRNRMTDEIDEVACDTLIFAKGRVPCTFFLKGTPIERDHTGAIIVDATGKTNLPDIYAAGSCTCLGDDDHTNSLEWAKETAKHLL